MKKKISEDFLKLIKIYAITFVLLNLSYSFFNWFLTTYIKILQVNEKYIDFWFPLIICFVISYYIFKPIVKNSKFENKETDASLWFIIPFSIAFPIIFSQGFYKNLDYKLIKIDKVTDILKHPNEKYFEISKFHVDKERYFAVNESHTVGKNGTKLVVSNYVTSAMYDDSIETNLPSKVGFGSLFSIALHNGPFETKENELKIKEFDSTSFVEYKNYDFYKSKNFERVFDSDDAEFYNNSWKRNQFSDKKLHPIVITRLERKISEINDRNKDWAIATTIISFFGALIILTLFEIIKK